MQLDFSSSSHYILALLPEVIISVGAMAVLLAGVGRRREGGSADLGWVSLAVLAAAAVANGWLYSGVEGADPAAMIAIDGFRLFVNWVFLVGAGFAIAISLTYVDRQRLQAGEYYSLILFATVGMMFMASARDLMLIFIGLELMSIAVYALVGINRRDARSAEAGLKYFLLGAFATGFLLFGIALVYGATGSVNLHEVAAAIQDGAAPAALLIPGVALLAIGLAFKVSAVPFHMWTPDVYEGAPTPVTAFMAAAVKTAAFAAFARVFLVGLDGVYDQWWSVLWWLSAITMAAGNLIALVQASVKRMLAYSSIAHGGYLLAGLVAASDTAVTALLFYLLVYTVMNIGAFAILISIGGQSEENASIESYAGVGWRRPVIGVFMTVFLLSLAGFPGTAGFIAKYQLLLSTAESELWTLSVILVLTTAVSYWYYLRVAWYMWMKEAPAGAAGVGAGDRPRGSPDGAEAHVTPAAGLHAGAQTPFATHAVLLVSVAVVLLGGILPGAVLEMAADSVAGLRVFAFR